MSVQPLVDAHVHLDCTSSQALASDRDDYMRRMEPLGLRGALVMSRSIERIDFFPEHERLLELAARDERIFPVLAVEVPAADDAVLGAVESWLVQGLAVAVKVYPGYHPFYPHEHPRSLELAAMLERLGVPLIVHSGATVTRKARLRHARPIHVDDLAVMHPALTIVMAHLGQPFFDEAQAVLRKNENVAADGSGLFSSKGDEFVRDQLVTLLVDRLRDLVTYVDADDVIHFGSDSPFADPVHHVRLWQLVCTELGVSDVEVQKLFYENARRRFKLPLDEEP